MLMELITCGVRFFFSVCTSEQQGLSGGEEEGEQRWESKADFDGGGKLEREL